MNKNPYRHHSKTRGMNRRAFLGWTAVGFLSAWSGSAAQKRRDVDRLALTDSQRVLVIGAGAAGLAAARTLADAGHDVLVIESRDRIGGRIHTSSQWADAPMDLGASWIHGITENPIAQIAEDLGLQTVATDNNSGESYGIDGQELSTAENLRVAELEAQIQQIIVQGQDAAIDRPLRETIEEGVGFDQLSAQDQRFVNLIITEIEQGLAGSADSLSTYWWDDPGFFRGDEVVFPTGYGAITDHLATGLAIELGAAVSEVAIDSSGVNVTTSRGNFTGDRVVVTLPLGVLKAGTVNFSPGLPADMQQAIDTLEMGILNKTYLRFPSVFWPQDIDWIQHVPQTHGQWVSWLNMDRVVAEPILAGFNAADFGLELESWTDQDIIAAGMDRLREIFGNGIPDPVDSQITRWGADPHTRGSYSYLPSGADPSMRDALAGNIEERVFFAGEATNRDYYPTVHGAYLSGLRAAEQVMNAGVIFADGFESGDTSRWTSASSLEISP